MRSWSRSLKMIQTIRVGMGGGQMDEIWDILSELKQGSRTSTTEPWTRNRATSAHPPRCNLSIQDLYHSRMVNWLIDLAVLAGALPSFATLDHAEKVFCLVRFR
jgi:hypothetical protein